MFQLSLTWIWIYSYFIQILCVHVNVASFVYSKQTFLLI